MNGYQQYKEQSVTTMTPGEMLLLLYDEAIKRLARAELSLKKDDFKTFDESIERTKEIFRYLTETLNRSYSISNELARFYDFVLYKLSRISASRKPDIIQEIRPLILDLRNTFKEADKISKQK